MHQASIVDKPLPNEETNSGIITSKRVQQFSLNTCSILYSRSSKLRGATVMQVILRLVSQFNIEAMFTTANTIVGPHAKAETLNPIIDRLCS